jgi:transcriptional regulator HilA, main transcriptional regulator of SPI1
LREKARIDIVRPEGTMSGQFWRFAGFEYSQVGGLQRDGAPVPIGPQARQLLELLLRSNGGVVSKAEIAASLWPGRPPSDDSIDRCAYLLRKPLREAGGGDVIATAYGRGLSLRARIELIDPEADSGRPRPASIDGRVAALWQTAYELSGHRTRDGFERAHRAVEDVLAIDPDSPEIRTFAADITIGRAMRGFIEPARARDMIEADAGRALEIAPDYPPALAALGWSRSTLSSTPDGGAELLDRAIDLDGRHSKARLYRGWARAGEERLDGAIADLDAGLEVSPLDQALLGVRAWLEICAGNVESGEKRARDGLERRPGAVGLAVVAAIAASLRGRHDEAIDVLETHLDTHPADPIVLSVLAYAQASAKKVAQASQTLAELDQTAWTPGIHAAAALLAMGRDEEAMRLLAARRAEGCPFLAFAAHDPRLAELRPQIARLGLAAQGRG